MVSIIERCLDGRSSFFKPNSEGLFTSMGRNEEGKIPEEAFVAAAESNPACRPVLDFIQAIELPINTQINVDLRQIQEAAQSVKPATPISEPAESFSKAVERLVHVHCSFSAASHGKDSRKQCGGARRQAEAVGREATTGLQSTLHPGYVCSLLV